MTTLAWIYIAVLVVGAVVAYGIALCFAASQGDDQLVRERELPWGS